MNLTRTKIVRLIGVAAVIAALVPSACPIVAHADASKVDKKIIIVVGPVTKTQTSPIHK